MYATALQRELWELDLATGATRMVAELPRRIVATGFLAGSERMVRTEIDLRIYRGDDQLVLVACAPVGAGSATIVDGGRMFLIGQHAAPQLVVLGWSGGVLARLAEI